MDGVLIDTEPVWRAAQSAVFAGFGVALSETDLLDSTGQPIEELIPVWRRRAPTASPLTDTEVTDLIVDRVIAHVKARSAGMRCVAVPDPLLAADPRYREADLVLESLTGLDEAALRRLGVPVPG